MTLSLELDAGVNFCIEMSKLGYQLVIFDVCFDKLLFLSFAKLPNVFDLEVKLVELVFFWVSCCNRCSWFNGFLDMLSHIIGVIAFLWWIE